MFKRLFLLSFAAGLVLASTPAFATFHLMQIEQVIGGVNGDTSIQAIQLRMRMMNQNTVSLGSLRAWDAAGANPILILDVALDVADGSAAGKTVLIVSPGFAAMFPSIPADSIMTNLIPASYLAAGKLTWEDDPLTTIWWSVAWGGAGYTGTNTGSMSNDADGNFNPPFGSALPSTTEQALLFTGTATDPSTNNAANYAITAGVATFTNNAGQSGMVPLELQKFDVE
jgi:hypothetical protein